MTELLSVVVDRATYVAATLLIGVGLYVLVDDRNLVRKIVGLNVFQTGIFLFLVASAFRADGRAPLLSAAGPYVNPLPHVLVLTAIVVGVSVTAVALALVARVYDTYGTYDVVAIREAAAARAATTRADREVREPREPSRGGEARR